MSDRNRGRKPGQMAGKAKKGAKKQARRMERDSDRMIDDQQRNAAGLGGGMKREAQQVRPDTTDEKSTEKRLQHR